MIITKAEVKLSKMVKALGRGRRDADKKPFGKSLTDFLRRGGSKGKGGA